MMVASHDGTMQAKRETDEIAHSTGQNLPTLVGGEDATGHAEPARKRSIIALDRPGAVAVGASGRRAAFGRRLIGRESVPHPETARPRDSVIEVVRKAIEEATATFQRMDAHSLSLVLNPDACTRLALQVKRHQGRLDALAILERGDLAALGTQWTRLQHRLAERGVRLAPLVSNLGQTSSLPNCRSRIQ